MRTLLLVIPFCSLASLLAQPKEIDPRTVVERAVTAHGGRDKLAQARADWVKLKGTLFVGDKDTPKEVPFVGETWVQLPGQFKNVLELTTPQGATRMVQTVNKDKVKITIDGQPHTVSPAALGEMRETAHLNNAVRLIPLLERAETYKLDYTGELEIQKKTLLGVKVTTRGQRELRLYFDKSNGMLVRTEQLLDDGNGKEVRQEVYYLDFRNLGGYTRPVKLAAYRDGRKVMEAELLEAKYHDKFPDDLFMP